ncbi:helix-turn-helix domain-containing protein [Acutalibacter intestini]|uniref:helix-turn-helix domain-containing protein n=1 Tax=Acutalibacter intestini TaxID=3093659 RepID=UPI002AC9ECE0|nr:helix-turn-helix domain-containing protein [Acutalibacter sp. M00204]
MRKNILQHIGAIVSGRRNEEHLTQQQLAQQTGRGLRHIQNIETGRVNASIEVLADIIYRLGLSADVSYPEMPKIEQQTKQLLCKFAACTEEERAFLLKTLDCMVGQMQDQHKNANKNIK